MRKIFNSSLLLLSLVSVDLSAGECNASSFICNSGNVDGESPFSVTFNEYSQGLSASVMDASAWRCEFTGACNNYLVLSSQVTSFMQFFDADGVERYVEEMDRWSEAGNWYLDFLETEDLNSDLTDDYAYAILDRFTYMNIDVNNTGTYVSFRGGDIIHGDDWDNNGRIDKLEIIPGITYVGGSSSIVFNKQ